ncbi:MAG: 4Fe-4S dicluster domain-containing protein [Acidobacteria bacterium]|nr:4Fe-4S dicluster domain-containing protein [Acidobacteriota bacterium]
MARAILYDSTLCVGCRQCEEACTKRWGMPYNDQIAAEEKLSAHKLTTIRTYGDKFSRKLCNHCVEPTCASVCPVKALQKTEFGPVIYDETRCIGCRYCMQACPYQVPSYEWSSRTPRVKKCNMCYERQKEGRPTACTEACPTGATICGERDELIREAQKRLAAKPGEYYQKIYGLKEVGGTSVLYLSAVPFEQIGLNTKVPNEPVPALTWRALSFVPDVVSAGATLLGGVYWITHRREAVAKAEGRKGGRK